MDSRFKKMFVNLLCHTSLFFPDWSCISLMRTTGRWLDVDMDMQRKIRRHRKSRDAPNPGAYMDSVFVFLYLPHIDLYCGLW